MRSSRRTARHILEDTYALAYPALRSAVREFPRAIQHPVGVHFGWWDQEETHGGRIRKAPCGLLCVLLPGPGRRHHPRPARSPRRGDGAQRLTAARRHHRQPPAAQRPRIPVVGHGSTRRDPRRRRPVLRLPACLDRRTARRPTVLVSPSAVQNLIEGEYVDTLMEKDATATLDDALVMIAGKTAELLSCACTLGAILSGADDERVQHLGRVRSPVGRRVPVHRRRPRNLGGSRGHRETGHVRSAVTEFSSR